MNRRPVRNMAMRTASSNRIHRPSRRLDESHRRLHHTMHEAYTRSVKIDEDIFIDMLWERVRETPWCNYYDDELWEGVFDILSEDGWLDPEHNNPSYIVDNLCINGEIIHKDDLEADGYDDKSAEEYIEDGDAFMIGDYLVFSFGL